MNRSKLRWFFSILGLLAVIALIWFLGPLLSLGGYEPLLSDFNRLLAILFVVVLWLLNIVRLVIKDSRANTQLADGIASAAEQPSEPSSADRAEVRSIEEVAALRNRFSEAMNVIKKMRGKGGQKLYELPWYIIIGPPGSGKTTALINSGLKFPLGERFGNPAIEGVGGTRDCDWWFTDDAVLLDTAGRYVTQDSDRNVDNAAWQGFLDLLKTHRRRRPINGVLVALSLQDLALQNDEQRAQHVWAVKQRIQELYAFFGIRFPVYVLFTKCDLVAGFSEFFDDLRREELAQAWGTTLDLQDNGDVSKFPPELDALLQRLNERMLARLEAEREPRRRSLIYGFPQQIASMQTLLTQFLHDIFAATRFEEQALLRGVYFTSGTQEGMPIDRMMGAVARNLGIHQQQVAPSHGPGKSYFITDVLKHVVFEEAELVGTNRKLERRRAWLQRAAYAGAIVLTAGAVAAWSTSYTQNVDYVGRMETKVAEYDAVALSEPDPGADFDTLLPPLEALYETTRVYEEFEGDVPWHMQLGMYQGSKLGFGAQEAYVRELRRLFLPFVANRVATHLSTNSDDPDFQYTALKTYVMLRETEHLDPDLLKLWMSLDWERSFPDDARKRDRLMAHLESLIAGGLGTVSLDDTVIEEARRRLKQVPLHELVYGRLKRDSQAVQKNAFKLADALGPTGRRVYTRQSDQSLDASIPELFTYRGYHEIFKEESPKLLETIRGEHWVLGVENDPLGQQELEELDVNLSRLYAKEYGRLWKTLINDLKVVPFGSVDEGVEVLEALSGRRSPMRGVLDAVAQNTKLSVLPGGAAAGVAEKASALGATAKRLKDMIGGADDDGNGDASTSPAVIIEQQFAELNAVVDGSEGAIPSIDDILDALTKVYNHMDALMAGEEGNPAVVRRLKGAALGQPEPVKAWLRQIVDASEVASGVQLAANEAAAVKELRDELRKKLREAWQADVLPMCRKALRGRYPVDPAAKQEMTIKDFGQLFGDQGLIHRFFTEHLSPYVDTSKSVWRWREVDGVSLGLPGALLDNFQLAEQIRDAFFQDGGTRPSVQFDLKPVFLSDQLTQFHLDIEGQKNIYRHGPTRAKSARWPNSDGPREVRIIFTDRAGKQTTFKEEGPWGWFRILDSATVEQNTPDRLSVTFSTEHKDATYEIIANSVVNPFQLEALQRFSCPDPL